MPIRERMSLFRDRVPPQAHDLHAVVDQHLFGDGWDSLCWRLARCERLRGVQRLIESKFDQPGLTLSVAAQDLAISKNHLNTLLARVTSKTFYALLTRYRLARAAAMLWRTEHSVLEVSMASGFGCVSSLERNLKRIFGSSPRELRKVMRACDDRAAGATPRRLERKTPVGPGDPASPVVWRASVPPGRAPRA